MSTSQESLGKSAHGNNDGPPSLSPQQPRLPPETCDDLVDLSELTSSSSLSPPGAQGRAALDLSAMGHSDKDCWATLVPLTPERALSSAASITSLELSCPAGAPPSRPAISERTATPQPLLNRAPSSLSRDSTLSAAAKPFVLPRHAMHLRPLFSPGQEKPLSPPPSPGRKSLQYGVEESWGNGGYIGGIPGWRSSVALMGTTTNELYVKTSLSAERITKAVPIRKDPMNEQHGRPVQSHEDDRQPEKPIPDSEAPETLSPSSEVPCATIEIPPMMSPSRMDQEHTDASHVGRKDIHRSVPVRTPPHGRAAKAFVGEHLSASAPSPSTTPMPAPASSPRDAMQPLSPPIGPESPLSRLATSLGKISLSSDDAPQGEPARACDPSTSGCDGEKRISPSGLVRELETCPTPRIDSQSPCQPNDNGNGLPRLPPANPLQNQQDDPFELLVALKSGMHQVKEEIGALDADFGDIVVRLQGHWTRAKTVSDDSTIQVRLAESERQVRELRAKLWESEGVRSALDDSMRDAASKSQRLERRNESLKKHLEELLKEVTSWESRAREVGNRYVRQKEHVRQLETKVARSKERSSYFTAVLLEGDSRMFDPREVVRGYDGGDEIARQILRSVDNLRGVLGESQDHGKTLIQLFLDVPEVCRQLVRIGLIGNQGVFRDFLDGFAEHHPLVSVIDVGDRFRPSARVKEHMSFLVDIDTCERIIIGARSSRHYQKLLDALQRDERIDRVHAIRSTRSEDGIPDPFDFLGKDRLLYVDCLFTDESTTWAEARSKLELADRAVSLARYDRMSPSVLSSRSQTPRPPSSLNKKDWLPKKALVAPCAVDSNPPISRGNVKTPRPDRNAEVRSPSPLPGPAPWLERNMARDTKQTPPPSTISASQRGGSYLDRLQMERLSRAGSNTRMDDSILPSSRSSRAVEKHKMEGMLVPFSVDLEGSVGGSPPESDDGEPSGLPHSAVKHVQRPIVLSDTTTLDLQDEARRPTTAIKVDEGAGAVERRSRDPSVAVQTSRNAVSFGARSTAGEVPAVDDRLHGFRIHSVGKGNARGGINQVRG